MQEFRSSRAGRFDAVYLRTAQAYMLISMPTGTSTIFGVFQVTPSSQEIWRELHAEVEPRTTPDTAQVRKIASNTCGPGLQPIFLSLTKRFRSWTRSAVAMVRSRSRMPTPKPRVVRSRSIVAIVVSSKPVALVDILPFTILLPSKLPSHSRQLNGPGQLPISRLATFLPSRVWRQSEVNRSR